MKINGLDGVAKTLPLSRIDRGRIDMVTKYGFDTDYDMEENAIEIFTSVDNGDYVKTEDFQELACYAEEAVDELEGYILSQYPLDQHYFPSMKRGYDNGMAVVTRVRKLIEGEV